MLPSGRRSPFSTAKWLRAAFRRSRRRPWACAATWSNTSLNLVASRRDTAKPTSASRRIASMNAVPGMIRTSLGPQAMRSAWNGKCARTEATPMPSPGSTQRIKCSRPSGRVVTERSLPRRRTITWVVELPRWTKVTPSAYRRFAACLRKASAEADGSSPSRSSRYDRLETARSEGLRLGFTLGLSRTQQFHWSKARLIPPRLAHLDATQLTRTS
jgi:hypothetical protein